MKRVTLVDRLGVKSKPFTTADFGYPGVSPIRPLQVVALYTLEEATDEWPEGSLPEEARSAWVIRPETARDLIRDLRQALATLDRGD